MQQILLNGKFTAQRMTGVQRYAHHMVLALDAALGAVGAVGAMGATGVAVPWVLLHPPQGRPPPLRHIEVREVGPAGLPLHAWEQAVLPWAARRGLLLNLAGSAPLQARRQWCTLHDAAVFDHPQAYTRSFTTWYRMHFRWQARHAERLLTVSAHSRQRLALRLGVAAAHIAVVPDGVNHLQALDADAAVLRRLQLQGRRWLLAVGSDNPMKNWPALLQAWQQVRTDADVRLVLVGGQDRAVFAAHGAASADDPRVLRAGVVSDSELKTLYAGALGLVFPSLDEGFGLPPLEAMSLGCPVAVAAAGAMPEVCGDAALYFDPRDRVAIAAAVQRLVDEPALRAGLAAAGHARALAMTWQASARVLLSLLAPAPGSGAGGVP